jgi:hypothetical protein
MIAVGIGVVLLLLPASASARKPIIAYVDGGAFKLYDAELGQDVAAPPVPVPEAGFRFGISRNGRYVFYNDADKKLHLLDRDTDTQVPLPGIDIYANPAFLTVSDGGLLAFDQNVNGPAVVYNSITKQFVTTGLPADNKNRQTQLSPGGTFLATTCDDPVDKCPAMTANSDPFVQNLTTMANVPLGAGAAVGTKDEEDPCIAGGGNLVGWQKQVGALDKDVFIYDRGADAFLNLPGLNDDMTDDAFCVLDRTGGYIGLMNLFGMTQTFKLYEVASDSFVPLPAKPFSSGNDANAIFSEPFTPSPKPMPAAATTAPAAVVKKKCKKKHRRKRAEAAKKKKCKRKRKR